MAGCSLHYFLFPFAFLLGAPRFQTRCFQKLELAFHRSFSIITCGESKQMWLLLVQEENPIAGDSICS